MLPVPTSWNSFPLKLAIIAIVVIVGIIAIVKIIIMVEIVGKKVAGGAMIITSYNKTFVL